MNTTSNSVPAFDYVEAACRGKTFGVLAAVDRQGRPTRPASCTGWRQPRRRLPSSSQHGRSAQRSATSGQTLRPSWSSRFGIASQVRLPIVANELFLAGWLLVKGFSSQPVGDDTERPATNYVGSLSDAASAD